MTQPAPDLIVHNGKLVTQDDRRSIAQAAAVRGRKFVAVGTDREVLALKGGRTKVVDLNGRTAIAKCRSTVFTGSVITPRLSPPVTLRGSLL
jgi:hypothetical protein